MNPTVSQIKNLWDVHLDKGNISHDPQVGRQEIKIGRFVFKYLPARAAYSQNNLQRITPKPSMPHAENEDVFCTIGEQIWKNQKLMELCGTNFTWDILTNFLPTEKHHCLLFPQDKPLQQLMFSRYLEDVLTFSKLYPSCSFAFNTMGAGASQNHFHLHLFFKQFPISFFPVTEVCDHEGTRIAQVSHYPLLCLVFDTKNHYHLVSILLQYLECLLQKEIAYNLLIWDSKIWLIPRKSELDSAGRKHGVDGVCGDLSAQCAKDIEWANQERLQTILMDIGFQTLRINNCVYVNDI